MNITIIFIIIAIVAIIFAIICLCNKIKIDNATKEENEKIFKEFTKLNEDYYSLINHKKALENEMPHYERYIKDLEDKIYKEKEHLSTIQNELANSIENQKKLSQEAFNNYFKILENKYKEAEEEHDMEIDALNTAYSNLQLKLIRERDQYQEDVDKIKATRAAAIQALTREKEIEEQLSFYCLTISDTELKDIAVLETVIPKLNQPRILNMLIWQTYFRTPMTNLCNNVIGTTIKTGIYKITNIKTKECYIGQAVDLAERFKQHAKCGLGIDTPAGNKLYQAMQEYGIQNFSWEVLEECSKDLLNEKEKFYIELYGAKDFGYNKTQGNK